MGCQDLVKRAIEALASHSYLYADEARLHALIGGALVQTGLEFVHEHRLDAKNRADFWLPIHDGGLVNIGIVIEVKVKGSLSDALFQCGRYRALPTVRAVILASSCRWADQLPTAEELASGVSVVHLRRSCF